MVGISWDLGLGRVGDLGLVDGGNIASFGGEIGVGGGNDGGSTGVNGATGDGFGGFEGVNTGILGDGFGRFGGVNTGMLGGTGDKVGGTNVSAGDGNIGADVGGVEVRPGGKGGNLGLGNGGTSLALRRRCRVAKATLLLESGENMKIAMIPRVDTKLNLCPEI